MLIENKVNFLKKMEAAEEGIVQQIIDANTFIVRNDRSRKIIRVRLDGVSKLSGNPKLKEITELQKIIENFTFQNLNQRAVFLDLTDFDEANNTFVGVVRMQGKGKDKVTFQ